MHTLLQLLSAWIACWVSMRALLQVFLSDKKKLKEYGSTEPLNRIKKELLKEV